MRLSKLPDRTPVKLSIVLAPSVARRLHEYADFYAETYGSREEVAELIPFILEAFLNSDAKFKNTKQRDELRKTSDRSNSASVQPSGRSDPAS